MGISRPVEMMKLVIPLYIYPLRDGELAPEWRQLKEAQESGVPVVAVANPGSGPGTEDDRPSYAQGMQALKDSGVEVVGYVASGYGQVRDEQVRLHMDRYKEWYGEWVTGIFIDETSHEADLSVRNDHGMCKKYKGFHSHAKSLFGDSTTVFMNTGTLGTAEALLIEAGRDVVWNLLEDSRKHLEETYGLMGKGPSMSHNGAHTKNSGKGGTADAIVGCPPPAPAVVRGRASFLAHGAADMLPEELCAWVTQLRNGGWSHVFMTDAFYNPNDPKLLNPWNSPPKYWDDLVKAVAAVNMPSTPGKAKASCSCFGR